MEAQATFPAVLRKTDFRHNLMTGNGDLVQSSRHGPSIRLFKLLMHQEPAPSQDQLELVFHYP